MFTAIANLTMTSTFNFAILGDAVQARFLMVGNIVTIDGRMFEITGDLVDCADGDAYFTAVNELGGIEGVKARPEAFIALVTVL